MTIYKDQGRDDLYEIESEELTVIQEFLPQPLDDAELRQMVSEIIVSEGADSMKDMGRVIKAVSSKAQGRADGKRIAQEVKSQLQ